MFKKKFFLQIKMVPTNSEYSKQTLGQCLELFRHYCATVHNTTSELITDEQYHRCATTFAANFQKFQYLTPSKPRFF